MLSDARRILSGVAFTRGPRPAKSTRLALRRNGCFGSLCKALHSRELGARGLEIEPGLVIPLEFGELGELVRPVPGKPTIRFWRADAGTGRAPPRVSAEADLKSRSAAVSRPC